MAEQMNRYVALQRIKVGDKMLEPGDEVPVDHTWVTIRELIDGKFIAAIPLHPDSFKAPLGSDWAALAPPGDYNPPAPEGAPAASESDEDDNDETPPDPNAEPPNPALTTEHGYNPSEHNVEDVLDYVEKHPDEKQEVIAAERAGKARKTVLGALGNE